MNAPARFEQSGRARVRVGGSDRRDFLDRMATNELGGLSPGEGAPTFFLERTGRVVDRVLVLEGGDHALLIGSEGRAAALMEWLGKYVIADDVELVDVGAETLLVTVLGPDAPRVLQEALGVTASSLARWRHCPASLGGAIVVRAEDVGGSSYHVIAPASAQAAIDAALAALPAGDAATYRRLRIQAGVPAFGEDFTDRTIPLETRQMDHISFTKGCYVGQEVIARLHNYKRVKRALVRLSIEGAAPPGEGAELFDGDRPAGRVTSAAPSGSVTLALGYVEAGHETPGHRLLLHDGESRRAAEILTLTPGEETP